MSSAEPNGKAKRSNRSKVEKDTRGRVRGKFAKGNHIGRGSGGPTARQFTLRRIALDEISDDDIRKIVRRMIVAAKGGDVRAAQEILDRGLGKAVQQIDANVLHADVTVPALPLAIKQLELIVAQRGMAPQVALPLVEQPVEGDNDSASPDNLDAP